VTESRTNSSGAAGRGQFAEAQARNSTRADLKAPWSEHRSRSEIGPGRTRFPAGSGVGRSGVSVVEQVAAWTCGTKRVGRSPKRQSQPPSGQPSPRGFTFLTARAMHKRRPEPTRSGRPKRERRPPPVGTRPPMPNARLRTGGRRLWAGRRTRCVWSFPAPGGAAAPPYRRVVVPVFVREPRTEAVRGSGVERPSDSSALTLTPALSLRERETRMAT